MRHSGGAGMSSTADGPVCGNKLKLVGAGEHADFPWLVPSTLSTHHHSAIPSRHRGICRSRPAVRGKR